MTEEVCDTAGESTNVEMAWHTDTTLMISTDEEKLCLDALAREQDRAVSKALCEVQDWHTEEFKAAASTTSLSQSIRHTIHLKCCSASHEEDVKRTREEFPETGGA